MNDNAKLPNLGHNLNDRVEVKINAIMENNSKGVYILLTR